MKLPLTVNVLGAFILNLPLSGLVDCSDIQDGQTILKTKNILHARKGMKILVDSVEYEVFEVEHSTDSIIIDAEIINPLVWQLQPLYYYHGTPYDTNNRLTKIKYDEKAPFAYLSEILREKRNNTLTNIVKESQIRMFFLDYANFRDWSTDDHYEERITGLSKLTDYFIDRLANERRLFFQENEEYDIINHVKFGQFTDFKGHTQSVFNEYLDGVELSFTLKMKEPCLNPAFTELCTNSFTNSSDSYLERVQYYNFKEKY